jgi:hypothetical protein
MILKARSSTVSTMLPSEVEYAVQTAVNGGSELLIFVLRAAHSHDSTSSPGKDCFDGPVHTEQQDLSLHCRGEATCYDG